MPAATARRLCPHGVFLYPRISYYAEVSRQIREIFERFTPLVEPLSLDEAFLDVTGSEQLFGSAGEIGRKIKEDHSGGNRFGCFGWCGHQQVSCQDRQRHQKARWFHGRRAGTSPKSSLILCPLNDCGA